jgi:hypothetical protein
MSVDEVRPQDRAISAAGHNGRTKARPVPESQAFRLT